MHPANRTTRRPPSWQPLVPRAGLGLVAAALATGIAVSCAGAPEPPPPAPAARTEAGSSVPLVEASGVAVRGRGAVAIVAGDETPDAFWAVSLDDFSQRWQLRFPPGTATLDDLEAIAPWGDDALFAITSQSRTKPRARVKEPRGRLAFVTLSPDARRIEAMKVYDGLRLHLLAYLAAAARDIIDDPKALGEESPVKGGLNVEGLAAWRGQLLLGLRSPTAKTGAIVIPINRPEKLFEAGPAAAPDFGPPLVIPAARGEAIRDMTPWGDRLLVLLGSQTDEPKPPFRLIQWDPASGNVRQVNVPGLKDVAVPEGIAIDPAGRLLVVQDQKPPLPKQILFRLDIAPTEQ